MFRSLVAASVAAAAVLLVPSAAQAAGPNLAAGKTFTASSSVDAYQPGNAGDGNASSYWESSSNAFPQWLQVDLGSAATVNQAILKLPPAAAWATRTQTLTIQGSTNGSSFSSLKASAGYVFNPSTGNSVTIDFTASSARYVRLAFTGNTGWPAGQLSELEVYGTGGTDPDPPLPGTNLAIGKAIEASSVTQNFVAANANDNNTATYWEGGAYPATLTVKLGANAGTSSVVVKLNPDPVWGQRTQTFSVLGREQSASSFTTLVGSATYTFNPATGNTVTVPVSATAADVRLSFTGNSGAPSGQVAEFQIYGTPAPNPDLTVTALTASPSAPVETDAITLSATVRNAGSAASPASNVNFYLGTTKVGTTTVGALAAGASSTVTANIGARNAGTYALRAVVDEANTVVEQNDTNNSFSSSSDLVVSPVASSDLVASVVNWSPSNPSAGNTVTFSVTIQNQGSSASAGGAHGVTLTLLNESGGTVQTLTGTYNGTLAPGASSPALTLGTWTAANGKYTVRVILANDANELPVKQANNTSERSFFVGRGANMPYDMYEAEDGQTGGGAQVLAANRRVGDLAGEASGRRAVTLPSTGSYVQWTTKASTNTVVARFSIPDGTTSSINVYVNNTLNKTLPLTSKFAWLYGAEDNPQNSGTGPRHIYDEANVMLTGSFPAGSTIKLQKDGGNAGTITIDFINTEQVAPIANPNPSTFVVPAGFDH